MRKRQRALVWMAAIFILVLAFLAERASAQGWVTWFVALPSTRISVDGRSVNGLVHRATSRDAFILTREGVPGRESYWIEGQGFRNCDSWRAWGFPLLALSESNGYDWTPICADIRSDPPVHRAVITPGLIEFTADEGERVRVTW